MKGANLTTIEMLTALGSRCNAKELAAEQKSKKNPWGTEQLCCICICYNKRLQREIFSNATNPERWPKTDQFNVEQNQLLKFFTIFPEKKTQWINKLYGSRGLKWLKICECSSLLSACWTNVTFLHINMNSAHWLLN